LSTTAKLPEERVERVTAALREQVADWRWASVVRALMSLRGVDFVAAVTLVAELGDFSRFTHPKELMSYLGLVPSEYSTGESRVQGKITKTGNAHVRRVLIESAWAYHYPARMGPQITARNQGQPEVVRAISWRAQLRLCTRFRRFTARGMKQNKICVAVARELAAFVWDVARHAPGIA
jgi:transposase